MYRVAYFIMVRVSKDWDDGFGVILKKYTRTTVKVT